MSSSNPNTSTSESSKILNIDSYSNSLWLVKVPSYIAEKWSNCVNGESLGLLTIANSEQGKKIFVSLNEDANNTSSNRNRPSATVNEFVLDEFSNNDSNQQHLIAFDYNNPTDVVSNTNTTNSVGTTGNVSSSYIMKGQVTKRSILKPKNKLSTEYKKLVTNRNLKASTHHESVIAPIYDLETRTNASHVVDFIPPASVTAGSGGAADLKRKLNQQQSETLRQMKSSNTNESSSSSSIAAATAMTSITAINPNATLRSRFFDAFTLNSKQSLKELIIYCQVTNATSGSSLSAVTTGGRGDS